MKRKYNISYKYDCSCSSTACRCKRRRFSAKRQTCKVCYSTFTSFGKDTCSKECEDFVIRYKCPTCFKEVAKPKLYKRTPYCSLGCKLYGRPTRSLDKHEIYNVFDHTCFICGEWIDINLEPGLPWSPTLDHVIPKSKGGSGDWFNFAPAHALCNHRKGDTVDYKLVNKLHERLYGVSREVVLF
jgi:5-methylcytosine-specific restriction endonuclease McrA